MDFYKFSATSGTVVRVTLGGDQSQPHPLTAPAASTHRDWAGFFTSDCPVEPTTRAFTISSPAHRELSMPPDGVFVIGVTACCDGNFPDGGTIQGSLSCLSNPRFPRFPSRCSYTARARIIPRRQPTDRCGSTLQRFVRFFLHRFMARGWPVVRLLLALSQGR